MIIMYQIKMKGNDIMTQVMTMASTRKVKKLAVRKYKALCHTYNEYVNIIDSTKSMLENQLWIKGTARALPTCIEVLEQLSEYALTVHLELQQAYDILKAELKAIDEVRANGGIILNPVNYMRVVEMRELGVYLKELNKETIGILHELTSITDQIKSIENE